MNESRSDILNAVLLPLAHGGWVDGLKVLREAMRTVHPAVASRHAIKLRERHGVSEEQPPLDELIESGRRALVRESMHSAIERGRLELDPPQLTRAHWRGELPWKVRDVDAGLLSVEQVAERIGLTRAVAYTWINNGYVPETVKSVGGHTRVREVDLAAWRAVKEAWPGLGKRWTTDPRSLWAAPSQACPHCGESIVVSITKG